MRGPSRRDIGHGNLAERALIPVLPSHEDFPYVIRLVSECLSSNGSTSMASTCGSTLALMDAGVPISAPVAGAAMGLISEPDGRFVVLTDILGKEDSVGDMDFKVTGTRDGITALQMDIKVQGINEAIIRGGLKQALDARLSILDKMVEVLPEARVEMSDFAPRIITIKINPEKIRDIIGKGGSMIRKIQEETQTEINVEDDGSVEIAAVSGENSRKAIQWIESLTREVEVGALYLGKEDSVGDKDFKVTGTRDGITALQMDIKVQGINEAIIRDGLKQALAARLEILDKMTAVLPEARGQMSDFAPRITTIKINPEKIRDIIGKGGSMIRKIQEETGTEINVEDDGSVEIAAVSGENSRKAIQWIESLTREVEIGALYLGKVTRIMGFGAFVEILPGKEGLVRIGELADYHVPTVEDVVSVGDEVMVVVIEVDRQGRINLSRKAAMQRHLAKEPVGAAEG
jgi:polyribonucleotide nucleotidyltransferase